ncbi:class I SAM-dependent methyltransferase [uncultured Enterovirga sp.]|uniref:class I SAM-dependent methyltransferase n=1 Tax=uncultured Enterovirga sp. TaxID=2026352 RepID=UPI0035CAEF58
MRAIRIWAAACAIMLGAQGAAKAQQDTVATGTQGVFVPRSGQEGKDVVWVPTEQTLVDRMLDMAGANEADYVIDLGSGDGRTVITAAKRGIKALGVEYDARMVALSRHNAAVAGVSDKAQFIQGDIFETDFKQATVLTLFLLPDLNLRLVPSILAMKPGTRVVSNTFTIGDWTPEESINVGEGCSSFCRAYRWVVPAKVGGTWQVPGGELKLTQRFQMVTGTLSANGEAVPISEGRLNGAEITFLAGQARYFGTVSGTRIEVKSPNGGTQTWTGVLDGS